MSMVFNSLAVESELGGVFDGTGLSSQRPRRRRNSGEEEPGWHSLRHSIRCAQFNWWIQRGSPIQIARSMTASHKVAFKACVWMLPKSTTDRWHNRTGPSHHLFQIPHLSPQQNLYRYLDYGIEFYEFYDFRYYLRLQGAYNTASDTDHVDQSIPQSWAIRKPVTHDCDVQMMQSIV